jgi:hypothetical protein
MNLVLVNAVKRRGAEDYMLRPITSRNVHVQGRVARTTIAGPIPVGILVQIVAIVEAIIHLMARGDEMAIEVGIVGIPGEFHSQSTRRDISEDPDSIVAALAIYVGSSHSYDIPALAKLKRGVEAIVKGAITLKSQRQGTTNRILGYGCSSNLAITNDRTHNRD